ncbi:MAG TPA: biopolymer transporter ExbD [Candidatus Binatia bacterium]|nr:biopolymer transporter ExbD [Candidatus Binatia bacterium]
MGAPKGNSDDELGPLAEINVTPLVDVMLVLLIIFMVTAPLMMVKLPIELPKISAEEVGKPKEPLIVGVDASTQLFYGEEPVSVDDMKSRLAEVATTEPDRMVYVQADKSVPYGQVIDLLGLVGQSGLAHVSLMAQQPG